MKKIYSFKYVCLTLCAIMLSSGSVMAAVTGTIAIATDATSASGNIADGTTRPGVNIKLSPGVELGYSLDATDGATFAINTQNSLIKREDGKATDRNEYGIASDYPGYYMINATQDLAAPGAADSSAFPTTSWTAQ